MSILVAPLFLVALLALAVGLVRVLELRETRRGYRRAAVEVVVLAVVSGLTLGIAVGAL